MPSSSTSPDPTASSSLLTLPPLTPAAPRRRPPPLPPPLPQPPSPPPLPPPRLQLTARASSSSALVVHLKRATSTSPLRSSASTRRLRSLITASYFTSTSKCVPFPFLVSICICALVVLVHNFRHLMQRFVELVRRGTEADKAAALDCLRTALAPCALDAYPVSAGATTPLISPESDVWASVWASN